MPRDHIPAGEPIGRRLILPPRLLNEDLYRAVRGLDRVHGDGQLPELPVSLDPGLGTEGRFVARGSEPSAILIRTNSARRGVTLLHEIGHLLDYAAISTPGSFASDRQWSGLNEWRHACDGSAASRHLNNLVTQLLETLPVSETSDHRRLRRFIEPSEFWARSYAQYVVTHSHEPDLIAELDLLRAVEPGRVYYPLQWDDRDFRLIGGAIERLFGRLGWRT